MQTLFCTNTGKCRTIARSGKAVAGVEVSVDKPAGKKLERVKGIEPSSQAWEARILPLNHTRFASNACNKSLTSAQLI